MQTLEEFMGSEFKKKPLLTLEELEQKIDRQVSRLATMNKMNAPKILLDDQQEQLEILMTMYQKEKYIISPAERMYRDKYDRKESEYYQLNY